MKADRIGKGEIAEVLGGKAAVLEVFVGLGNDLIHLLHVPVSDVGAEEGIQACSERQGLSVEGPNGARVIGFAPEEENGDEEVADLLRSLDSAGRPFVEAGEVGLVPAG